MAKGSSSYASAPRGQTDIPTFGFPHLVPTPARRRGTITISRHPGRNQHSLNRRTWPSRLELQAAALEYVEAFHNRQRRHSNPRHDLPSHLRTTLFAQRLTTLAPITNNQLNPSTRVSRKPGQVH
jgi:hypothetical protein